MNKRLIALLGVVVVFGAVFAAQKFITKKKGSDKAKVAVVAEPADEKSVAVLTAAQTACAAIKMGSYEATYYNEGALAFDSAKVIATVTFDLTRDAYRVSGTVIPKDGPEQKLDQATDGETAALLDHGRRIHVHGSYPQARGLIRDIIRLAVPELGADDAFETALTRSCKYEGVQEVNGTACDVVYVPQARARASRWFIGAEDHLPRRIERIVNLYPGNEGKDKMVLILASIKARSDFGPDSFVLATPEGYEDLEMPGMQPLLTVGTEAPNWALRSPSGDQVTLVDLRGQVVVMDFWATWCGPCKMAMPGLQELHAEMDSQGVKVLGINCSEQPGGDPEGYMKRKKFTYTLLMEGDAVARQYRAIGLPTIYVIDTKGTIVYAATGYGGGMEEVLRKAVEGALEKKET